VYSAVAPNSNAQITRIKVAPGQSVKKGQVLAELENPQLIQQLKTTTAYATRLQTQYEKLANTAKREIQNRRAAIEGKNVISRRALKAEEASLEEAKSLLTIREKAFEKGIETKLGVAASKKDYFRTKHEIENIKGEMAQNSIALANFTDQWAHRLREMEAKVDAQKHQLNELTGQLTSGNTIRSPIDGTVVGVEKSLGDVVKGGDTLVSIASPGKGLDAVIYVASEDAQQLKTEMNAFISPNAFKKEEFGSIRGKVVYVSQFPTTEKAMTAVLRNRELIQEFLKKGTPIAVRVRLYEDENTHSGYDWTSSKGPKHSISPGTLVTARITVREQPPIALLIPAFKKMIGL